MRRLALSLIGGMVVGGTVTLIGIVGPRTMEHLRWPGAVMMMFLGPVTEWIFGFAGHSSQGRSIVLDVVFIIANSAFWAVPVMILLYAILWLPKH